ncbi:MAG: hypothetical protein IJV31_03350 [Clostridia bacterium]|nr:hypothetical protein [Clostridia bacterium]
MKKIVKLTDNNFLDSTSIVHNKQLLNDILKWELQSFTTNSEYITQNGYCNCYKMNGLAVFSFNFNVKEINTKDITLITGLPKCKSGRYVFGLSGNNTVAKGYITSGGELKNDGNWASGWYNAIVVYPAN